MGKLPRPFDRWTTYPGHGGIDYPQPTRTLVRASGDGMVTYSGWLNDRAGWTKRVTYNVGVDVLYCHLVDGSGSAVGDRVRYGTGFAHVGTSGHSTGPHLHSECRIAGILQDYWSWFDQEHYVGDGTAAGAAGATEEEGYSDMFIANVKGSFYLVVPQGAQKPTGVVLGRDSGARESGIPVLNFTGAQEIIDLKAAVTGIG